VNRHKVRDRVAIAKTPGVYNYNYNDGNTFRLFSEGENRAMLGVTTEKTDQGVEIQEITKESAAEKAGLKKGDVITKVDDVKITDPDVLSEAITKHKPGDKVTVTYLRDKKEQKATAELTKWKGLGAFGLAPGHDFKMDMGDLNLKLDDLKGQLKTMPRTDVFGQWNANPARPKLGLSVQDTEDGKGVKVIEVDDEGTAKKAGIKANDVITEVDGKAVKNADEVAKIVRESKDKASLMFKLQRDGKTQNIEVKIPKKLKTADL
jgi:serine protease Do